MNRRLRSGFVVTALIFLAPLLSAQSNEMIDSILGEDVATIGSAAYVALSSADLVPDDATGDRAVSVAVQAGWLPEATTADSPVTFGQLAYLLMQAHDVRGGLMYLIFPGPRYAAREFVFKQWSPEQKAPGDHVSGQFLVRVTGNFLDKLEASR